MFRPAKLFLRLLINTCLGFLALWALNLIGEGFGLSLGFNLFNAVVVGVLGVPGVALLLLLQWLG